MDKAKTFVHVLTESTLEILLQTLDTISDLVGYLDKKEKFIRRMLSVIVPGEEELLAYFLQHSNDEGEYDFVLDAKFNAFTLEEGFWEDFHKSPRRLRQVEENGLSYTWDDLIERFSLHAMNATQYFANHLDLSQTEKGLRFMAAEPRTMRRLIMKNIIDVFTNTPDGTRRIKCLNPPSPNRLYYVFLCLPKPDHVTYDKYREVRGNMLEACVKVAKHKFPEALDIVGIASEPLRPDPQSSEDLIYLDARVWSAVDDADAARVQKELKILTAPTTSSSRDYDYPE